MAVLLGNQPCLDPKVLWRAALAERLPTDGWFGKANSFRCPAGPATGRGWLLLSRKSLDTLDLNQPQTLTFAVGGQPPVTLAAVWVLRADNATPGWRGDKQASYVVEIVDRRHFLAQVPLDRGYNVRAAPEVGLSPAAYLPATLQDSQPWTWQAMAADIWSVLGLGPFPGLPVEPDGIPDGGLLFDGDSWQEWGGSAWEALHQVLDRLGCTSVYNPLADRFDVVEVGAASEATTTALERWDAYRLWDSEAIQPARTRLPEFVRVLFKKQPQPVEGHSPWHLVDVADTDPDPNASIGTYVTLHDDEPALYGTGTLQNGAALASRGAWRAAAWFAAQKGSSPGLERVYRLPLADAGLMPGAQIAEIGWEDRGRGVKTTVVQRRPQDRERSQLPPGRVHAMLRTTSSTPSTITLLSGQTLQGYAAVLDSWDGNSTDGTNPVWTDAARPMWVIGTDGAVPVLGKIYDCRLLGVDSEGVAIWVTCCNAADLQCSSQTPQTITLYQPGGSDGYLSDVYPAKIVQFLSPTNYVEGNAAEMGWFSAAATVWLWMVNGSIPQLWSLSDIADTAMTYHCHYMGSDTSGVPVYGYFDEAIPVASGSLPGGGAQLSEGGDSWQSFGSCIVLPEPGLYLVVASVCGSVSVESVAVKTTGGGTVSLPKSPGGGLYVMLSGPGVVTPAQACVASPNNFGSATLASLVVITAQTKTPWQIEVKALVQGDVDGDSPIATFGGDNNIGSTIFWLRLSGAPYARDLITGSCAGGGSGGGSGSSGGGSGSSGSGGSITFFDLCPGETFNDSYTLTISGATGAWFGYNGSYPITWSTGGGFDGGGSWGYASGIYSLTVLDNDGAVGLEFFFGSKQYLGNASSYTCPPTFTASGTLSDGAGNSFDWSIS